MEPKPQDLHDSGQLYSVKPSPVCTKRKERDMGSRDFNKSPHKQVSNPSEVQDKDSGALFLLIAQAGE